jgi:hypothetical protein
MFNHERYNVSQLFETPVEGNSSSYFQVPAYQRKYEWEKEKQVARLIDDIFETMGKPYFMGPLILCARPSEGTNGRPNYVELIDGQQRLATLAVFMRALIDYIQKRKSDASFPARLQEKMNNIQYTLRGKIIKGELVTNEPVIHLSSKIDWFFREEILMNNADKTEGDRLKKMKKGQHRAITKLVDAYLKIWQRLKDEYDSKTGEELLAQLSRLANSILTEKMFLVIGVQDYADAYSIFETINERGKRLTLSDLVKNLCFKKMDALGQKNLEDFEEQWDDAEVWVSDFAGFIWHAWVSRFDSCPKSALFRELEKRMKGMDAEKAFDFATDLVLNEVRYYHNYENPAEEPDEEKRRYLRVLRTMDATRCYPLLLSVDSAREKGSIGAQASNSIIKIITCLTFWYSGVCGKDAKRLESHYHDLARKMRSMEKEESAATLGRIAEELQKQFPTMGECKAAFTESRFMDTDFVKMILEHVEDAEYRKAEMRLKSGKEVELEHILPKHPDPAWRDVFPDDRDLQEYTYKLGNYTLVYGPLNRKALNAPFAKKKKIYESSEVGLTKELISVEKWDAEEINRRTERLFELVQKVWPISGSRVYKPDAIRDKRKGKSV